MFSLSLSSLHFEKPGLMFLALLLSDDFDVDSRMTVPAEMGRLFFEQAELVQERGRLPRLCFDFSMDDGNVRLSYFGHVSPFKLNYFEMRSDCQPKCRITYSEPGRFEAKYEAADLSLWSKKITEVQNIIKSVYLWRSCEGLPKIVSADLEKYFTKMKLVSRYQWEKTSYLVENNCIYEKWYAVVENDEIQRRVVVTLQDGLISDVLC